MGRFMEAMEVSQKSERKIAALNEIKRLSYETAELIKNLLKKKP